MKYLKYIFIIITLIAVSCKSEKSEKNTTSKVEETTSQPQQKQITYIEVQPDASQKFHTIGDEIDIALNFHADIKSIYYKVKCNDEVIDSVSTKQTTYKWHSAKQGKAGENELTFAIEENGKLQEASINVILLPKEAPRQLSYKIINTYPHDREAYTQGLFFKDNFFYEATGLKGESSVRKVKPETGQVLRSFAVATDIFGEGITSFDDKIIQLSWQAGRGFVYRMSDFKLLNEFQYQGEGWGIDYHNNKLYMTDGTNTIKILDDQNFITIAEIKVFDNKGAVNYLNEVEFIDNKIWANIYQSEDVAIINPETGIVEAYVNFAGLLSPQDYRSDTDVLNGIAYDKAQNRIFVTGKKWPKLFEIEVR